MLSKLATLQELKEIYGVEDLYQLNEIVLIDDYNECLLHEDAMEKESFEAELAKRSQMM